MDALKEMTDVSGNHLFMIMLLERIEKLEDEINNKELCTLKEELNAFNQKIANIQPIQPFNNMANDPFLKLVLALVLALSGLFLNLIIDVVKLKHKIN